MQYDAEKSKQILQRTPDILKIMLSGLDESWIYNNEGPDTFSPFDVVGHLLHGETSDWPVRIQLILDNGSSQAFTPYDRFAMYNTSVGRSLDDLLADFSVLRKENLQLVDTFSLGEAEYEKKGLHPVLGEVTLRQLLSTWVVHDLTHIAQISRTMARQYKEEIGPWVQFFRILDF